MRSDILVLCYHGVSDSWPAETAVTAQSLEDHVGSLLARGFRAATFTDALTAPSHPRTLAVTFDDAASSVYRDAMPVLSSLGVPGTVFVPTDFPGLPVLTTWDGLEQWLGGAHEHELGCMSWEQLADLVEAGWEVGSHTCSHPHLTALDDDALAMELSKSRLECERRLDVPCHSLAYPYGDVDARVARAARLAGYVTGATAPVSAQTPLPLLWPRVGVYRGDTSRRVWLRARRRALGLSPVAGSLFSTAARVARMSGRRGAVEG